MPRRKESPLDNLQEVDPREISKRSRQLERSIQRRRRIARQLATLDDEIRRQRRLLGDLMLGPAPFTVTVNTKTTPPNGAEPTTPRRGRPRIIRHTSPART